MQVPVLSELVSFIEALFEHHGKEIAQAAGEAAATAALTTAEVDPKTQAVTAGAIALLTAAQQLKAAISQAPGTTTVPTPEAAASVAQAPNPPAAS